MKRELYPADKEAAAEGLILALGKNGPAMRDVGALGLFGGACIGHGAAREYAEALIELAVAFGPRDFRDLDGGQMFDPVGKDILDSKAHIYRHCAFALGIL